MIQENFNHLLPSQQQLPLLLDTELLAHVTGFAEQTLRHWANKTRKPPHGWPEPVRIGRNVRYRTAEILEWIALGCPAAEISTLPVSVDTTIYVKRGRGRPKKKAG